MIDADINILIHLSKSKNVKSGIAWKVSEISVMMCLLVDQKARQQLGAWIMFNVLIRKNYKRLTKTTGNQIQTKAGLQNNKTEG